MLVLKYLQREENLANGASLESHTKTHLKVGAKEIHTRNKLGALKRKIIKPGISHREFRNSLDVSF